MFSSRSSHGHSAKTPRKSRREMQRRDETRRARRTTFIERLEDRRLLASDCGDAPFPYLTTLGEDGTRHGVSMLTLGTGRDDEADGSWGGPGVQAIASRDVVSGDNVFDFDVPNNAITAVTYAQSRRCSVVALVARLGGGGDGAACRLHRDHAAIAV